MLSEIIHSKSKTFIAFCFCFLAGVGLWSVVDKRVDGVVWLVGLFLGLWLFPLVYKKPVRRFFLLSIFFFSLGIFRVNISIPEPSPNFISFYNGQKQTFTALIVSEPDVRIEGVNYIAEVVAWQAPEKVSGRVFFQAPLYPRLNYGDLVELKCILKTPEPIEDFRYDKYLAKFGVYSICSHPTIAFQQSGQGNSLYAFILKGKNALAQNINTLWHEPYASFVAGILYGYRGGLGTLQEDFNRTGVTHIVAVSGFNITLIASIFSAFLVYMRVPRKKAFWIVVTAIVVFVLFVGASASVVRAGIMGTIVLIAKQLGRPSRALPVILLAMTLMTLHNPLVLLWDAGFQLSVLSTLGLITFSPILEKKLQFFPQFLGLRESLSSTVSAILVTLPLILWQFGRLSLVAPLVNILILPTIPLAMALGFGSVTLSFLYLPFAILVSYLTFFVLAYVVTVVRWFSALPFASVEVSIPLWFMIILYSIIFWFYQFSKKKYA